MYLLTFVNIYTMECATLSHPAMYWQSWFPRLRTVVSLGCIALVCILSWDLILLNRLYSFRPSLGILSLRRNADVKWYWTCVTDSDGLKFCQKTLKRQRKPDASSMTLTTCKMTCSPGRYIWPSPTGKMKISNTTASFHPRQLKIDFEPVNHLALAILLKKATKLYQERIASLAKRSRSHTSISIMNVTIHVNPKKFENYKINVDESYKLIISQKGFHLNALIQASTYLGAHHGLETLTQLVWWDEEERVLKVLNSVVVSDAPIFTFRGLMLDTSNSFIPTSAIFRTLEAMSLTKLNVFHWHISGSKSFPFASTKYPKFLHSGPYSSKEIYSTEDIRQVVKFAEVRGITVVMEVDNPAHNSEGWDWGIDEGKGNLSLCQSSQPFSDFCTEPPCGQLNPVNEHVYSILVDLMKELKEITRTQNIIHIGGDDIDFRCWESSEEVTSSGIFLKRGVIGIWEHFYSTLIRKMEKEKFNAKNWIIWSNDVLEETDIRRILKPTDPIVQSSAPSTSGEVERLLKRKYRVILSSSDTWDLSEPQSWQIAYNHHPWWDLSHAERRLVLGGEVLVFTDLLDKHSLQTSVWPSAATMAERLWSDPPSNPFTLDRLLRLRERMMEEGIPCSPVAPEWCLQNPYQCS